MFSRPVSTAWGTFDLKASKKGLLSISFPGKRSPKISQEMPKNIQTVFANSAKELKKYIRWGAIKRSGIRVDDSRLSKMQKLMLKKLSQVKEGEVRTYRWLAEQCGIPKGARAIGQLLGSNPIPIFFPCHRIIRSDGSFGGFSGGEGWKEKLLNHEKLKKGCLVESKANRPNR